MSESQDKRSWLDRPLFTSTPALTGEMLLFGLIVVLVAVSRLYDLGARVMSHDESLHVYFSWLFYQGQGYQHNPMMHGPLQFHLIALIFFLFRDSDFTARLPHAIASILTVVMLWNWRRYLGRAGTMVAAGLMLISPFMLYYGRYARNEALVGLFGVLTLYAILRYLETGKVRYLFLLTAATALHFTSKETAFIYTAQAMLFLAIYLIGRVTRITWNNGAFYNGFLIALAVGVILLGAAGGLAIYQHSTASLNPSQTASPIVPGGTQEIAGAASPNLPSYVTLLGIAALAFIVAGVLLIAGYGWRNLRAERSFDMLILLGTLVLPQLTALPVKLLGWDPLNYSFTWPGWDIQALLAQQPVRTAIFLLAFIFVSIGIGLLWDERLWLLNAAVFYGIYVFFYSTIFTNWQGILTGMVGSMGYWLEQQGVHRGSQPWYYYLLIQIPIYEFLPALGLGLAAYLGLRRKTPAPLPPDEPPAPARKRPTKAEPDPRPKMITEGNHTFILLFWWSLSSLFAFTIAGEKMPWLTFHITLPMILITAWALGQIIERVDWQRVRMKRGFLVITLLTVFLIGLATSLVMLLGPNPPFQGKTLVQLSASAAFLLAFAVTLGSAFGLAYLLADWEARHVLRLTTLVIFSLLAILTGRAAFRAAYVNYDDATEYLVYAHGSSGIKDVMEQIDRISKQTAGGSTLDVAYDVSLPKQGVSWPFLWYLRAYSNKTTFDQPSIDLRNAPVIIVEQKNFDSITPIVRDQYYKFDYSRILWPNQDYFGLTWPRLANVIKNPSLRAAIFQIWLNRDYSLYSQVTGENSFTLSTWEPSDKMEFFVRKDVAAQIWEYGIISAQVDPYKQATIILPADKMFGVQGQSEGQLNDPHGIAVAPDGSIYVADTNNNRIQHFTADGVLIKAWGGNTGALVSPAPLGTFNQPWDVALSPDGKWIYVTDTWNHRIEKFTADGTAVAEWGHALFDQTDDPFGLWGPRGITVDKLGRVYVTDTGNKRIVVYDADGKFITQFGSAGTDAGQFDEPVGLALDSQGNVYVVDTWNQRIQVFSPGSDGITFTPLRQWNVDGWFGQALENKPYLAIDAQDHVFVTDPEMYRVLEFNTDGTFIRTWGDYGTDANSFGLASAVAIDKAGQIWVTDAANDRIMHFTLP